MKKFGEVVEFVRNGVPVKALVVQSNIQKDGENLTVAYLDPAMASNSMAGILVDKAIAKAFVTPLTEGKSYGWQDLPEAVAAEAPEASTEQLTEANQRIDALQKDFDAAMTANDTAVAELKKVADELAKANDANVALTQEVENLKAELAKPSAADLDAHADEQKVKELTEHFEEKTAPEQLDEVQGEVQPGDPDSPHAI